MEKVNVPIHINVAAGAAGAIAAYAVAQGGTAALNSNLMYPILFPPLASVVFDMVPQVSSSLHSLTGGNSRLARSAFILASEVVGLTVMYPAISMQERILFGVLGGVGAYLL